MRCFRTGFAGAGNDGGAVFSEHRERWTGCFEGVSVVIE